MHSLVLLKEQKRVILFIYSFTPSKTTIQTKKVKQKLSKNHFWKVLFAVFDLCFVREWLIHWAHPLILTQVSRGLSQSSVQWREHRVKVTGGEGHPKLLSTLVQADLEPVYMTKQIWRGASTGGDFASKTNVAKLLYTKKNFCLCLCMHFITAFPNQTVFHFLYADAWLSWLTACLR